MNARAPKQILALVAVEAARSAAPAAARGVGGAGTGDRSQDLWAGLPPEQRQEMRQQMREQWQQNPPDNWDGRHQPMPATPISQEERHRLREEMRGQQGPRGEGRGRRGGWH